MKAVFYFCLQFFFYWILIKDWGFLTIFLLFHLKKKKRLGVKNGFCTWVILRIRPAIKGISSTYIYYNLYLEEIIILFFKISSALTLSQWENTMFISIVFVDIIIISNQSVRYMISFEATDRTRIPIGSSCID